jgi:hypothetical protein
VPEANSVRLGVAIRESGGCARVITYSGLDHVGIVLALALPRFPIAPVLDDLTAFMRRPTEACSSGPG